MGGNPPGRRCGRPALLGLRATAIVGVIVQPVCLEAAAREIATFEEVSYLVMTSGTFDLLVVDHDLAPHCRFELPTVGEVYLGGKLRGETPPYHRPVNTVFQSMLFSLIMNVNVFGNVAFGLEMRKVPTSHCITA
jgi:hypothetical protein